MSGSRFLYERGNEGNRWAAMELGGGQDTARGLFSSFLSVLFRHGHIVSVELRGYPHLLCSALMP